MMPATIVSAAPAPVAATPSAGVAATDTATLALLSSAQLLGGGSAVRIEHRGAQYVLRATRAGKLILTK